MGVERFKCAEALFQPVLAGFEIEGLHRYLYDSAMKCDVEARRDLL